jgi:hypothetical protein
LEAIDHPFSTATVPQNLKHAREPFSSTELNIVADVWIIHPASIFALFLYLLRPNAGELVKSTQFHF